MQFRKQYNELYNTKNENEDYIVRPDKNFHGKRIDEVGGYMDYLDSLIQYYKQLHPLWEFHLDSLAYLVLYDHHSNSCEVHRWNTDGSQNHVSELFYKAVPCGLGYYEQKDVFDWFVGHLLNLKYSSGIGTDRIDKIVRCDDLEVFYQKEGIS